MSSAESLAVALEAGAGVCRALADGFHEAARRLETLAAGTGSSFVPRSSAGVRSAGKHRP